MDIEQFRHVVKDLLRDAVKQGILEGLSIDDVKYTADLAFKVRAGEITEQQAVEALREYGKSRGFDVTNDVQFTTLPADEDEYKGAISGMVEITDKVQKALIEAGEPGIADALMEVKVPRESPIDSSSAAVAIAAKAWFNWEGCHPYEVEMVRRAIRLAAQSEGIEWMP